MNAKHFYKTMALLWFGLLASVMLTPTLALAITPAQKPLYIGVSSALPNIMLMIDNSGSMRTNVDSNAYTPSDKPDNFNYNCGVTVFGGVTAPATPTTTVNMVVDSSGVPRFCTNSICNTSTAFSNQKCFNNVLTYKVDYYHGTGLAKSTYLGAELNWYFKSGTFTKGSLIWVATTPRPRIDIAKDAAINLVNSLIPDQGNNPTVRLGLATYRDPWGGQIISEIRTLDESYAAVILPKITALPIDGYTPLAETLADIGRYFSEGGNGYTGNLTLHPQSNQTPASLDAIFNNGLSSPTRHQIYNTVASSTNPANFSVPVENYCQKNFAILVTDGLPTKDREISTLLRDYSGDCATKLLCKADASGDTVDSLPSGPLLPIVALPPKTTILPTDQTCKTDATSTSTTGRYFLACQNGTKAGRKYESSAPGASDYLDDVAQALYEIDLRPDWEVKGFPPVKNNLTTYTIGFADPSLTEDRNKNNRLDLLPLPSEDINGNGQLDKSLLEDAADRGGGKFYFANNLGELADSFKNVLGDIASKIGSSSSVAANSTRLGSDTAIYQAKFDSADWTGSFIALPLNINTGAIGAKVWEAAEKIPDYSSRNIVTYNPDAAKGISFTCEQLTTSQKTTLGITNCLSTSDQGVWRLNYLRGDYSHEIKNPLRKSTDLKRSSTGIFRNRTRIDPATSDALQTDPWLLGDIVNSDPVYVGFENYGYNKLPDNPSHPAEKNNYVGFVNTNKLRRKMVYIGSNDGFFHGFDANLTTTAATPTTPATDGGKEILAYLPNAVYSQMRALSDPDYGKISNPHHYFADGSPRVADAYFGDAWHTVLASTTGAGGQAVFALDITDPLTFDENDVLWEISDTSSPTASDLGDTVWSGFANNLGYALPQPSIVRLNDGSWVAVIANGYGSVNNRAVLYLVDIKDGHIIKAFDTAAGDAAAPNGLSTPIAVDIDGNRTVDVIYAGDLLGNLWKFYVSAPSSPSTPTSPIDWKIANGGSPLFVACSNASACNTSRQPITAKPQVGRVGKNNGQNNKGLMIYFGTGKYFEESDINVTDAQTQTLYGIWDNEATVARSNLQEQKITHELTGGSFKARVTTETPVNYSDTALVTTPPTPADNINRKGWFMDLLKPDATDSDGERSVSTPLMRGSKVVFTTLIPIPPTNTDTCGAGSDGTSWLMEMEAVSGSRIKDTGTGGPFDLNNDGNIDSEDTVEIGIGKDKTIVTGIEPDKGIFDTPTVVSVNNKVEIKIINGTNQTAGPGIITETPATGGGSSSTGGSRQSWQQLNIDD